MLRALKKVKLTTKIDILKLMALFTLKQNVLHNISIMTFIKLDYVNQFERANLK